MPPHERRLPATQFTRREIYDIVNDPANNPYDGGLHFPRKFSTKLRDAKKLKFTTFGNSGVEYEFIDENHLRRSQRGVWIEEYYESYDAAPGIVFFFHLHTNGKGKSTPPPKMSAYCVDFNTGLVTINDAQIGHYDYTPRDVSGSISFAAFEVNGKLPAERHSFTDDFVGKVAAWDVGGMWLTHHYINPQFFLNEIGGGADSLFLTIAEPARYVKVAENIYVFTWREMAGPGLMGMDVMDTSKMQSVGMFYGISEDDRLECYCFTRHAGKWLSVEDRKKMHKDGIFSVIADVPRYPVFGE
ncbi:MAG: hypothetical protein LBS90_06020 [Oscillospiraceae bacterium]|jgi:hypothetical protein|nr:hypothetical protein [Oscillospiraceae bacterium]